MIYVRTLKYFSHLEQRVQFWAPQNRKDIIKVLEHLPCEGLRELDLSSMGKRSLQWPYQQIPMYPWGGNQED